MAVTDQMIDAGAEAAHIDACPGTGLSLENPAEVFLAMWRAAPQPPKAEPVPDLDYSIEQDLEETQQQLAEAENKLEQYEGFFIGEDGNSFDRDPEALISSFISRFGKPRTIPDAITASAAISSHYARGWNDYRQKIIEQIAAPQPPKAAPEIPGLVWAVQKFKALQNNGFETTHLRIIQRDFENAIESFRGASATAVDDQEGADHE